MNWVGGIDGQVYARTKKVDNVKGQGEGHQAGS